MSAPTQFFDVAQTALDCVCSAMDAQAGEEGVPSGYGCPTCYQYVSAGEPNLDCCVTSCDEIDGMLTVHTEDIYDSDVFPNRSETFEPCKASTWVAVLVVTASRCAPSMDEEGNPASNEELTANALVQAIDTYAILQGLGCCLVADAPGNKRKRRVQIQGVRPLISEGGCSSVEVRATVELGPVCPCPPEPS